MMLQYTIKGKGLRPPALSIREQVFLQMGSRHVGITEKVGTGPSDVCVGLSRLVYSC